NIGLNLARFFSKKIILGMNVDFKIWGRNTKQFLSNKFIDDFNSAFVYSYSDEKDSARALYLQNAVNGTNGHSFKGNIFADVGISFSPFPSKYGGILFQVKRGDREIFITGNAGFLPPPYKNETYVPIFYITKVYSFELSFKPISIFKETETDFNKITHYQKRKISRICEGIIVSFYYEKLQLKNANVDGMSLDKMLNQRFISKYNNLNNFGIKIGLGIY
ncbi:MAG: hypothetical protein ACXVDW_15670, partial [Bacteroidia bacterium]